jgi:thiamine-phosphate pyrophosphorylase
MDVVVISSPEVLKHEVQIINELFEKGLSKLHLRKPNWEKRDVINLLNRIDASYHHKIALHQYHDLVEIFDIKHLHFKEKDRIHITDELLMYYKSKGYCLSTSVHNLSQLDNLRHIDYTFYGPLFDSISKSNYKGKYNQRFKLDRLNKKLKIYAVGGIAKENMHVALKLGFDGVGLLGTIWKQPLKAINQYLNLIK